MTLQQSSNLLLSSSIRSPSPAELLQEAAKPFSPTAAPSPQQASRPAAQRPQPPQQQQQPRQSPKRKQSGTLRRQHQAAPAKRHHSSLQQGLVVQDDSKPASFGDVGSGFGLQTVVLRPPFSLF